MVRVAASQHRLHAPRDWDDYAAIVRARHAEVPDAAVLVFPEYGSLEMATLLPPGLSLGEQIVALQALREPFLALHRDEARRADRLVLAPSFPWATERGLRNRAWLLAPEGEVFQDKIHPTPYEAVALGVQGGDRPAVVRWRGLALGVAICYDAEFPAQVRSLCEAGIEILLVPSCTEGPSGASRVHIAARARALEMQAFVVQAPLTGGSQACEAIDHCVGCAGAFAPPDVGFPDDGVLAAGSDDLDGWLAVDLPVGRIARVRARGQVRNFNDAARPIPPAEIHGLGALPDADAGFEDLSGGAGWRDE